MELFYTDHFDLLLPEGHRFPIAKYRLLRKRLAEANPDGRFRFVEAPPATDQQLCLAHQANYVRRVCSGELTAAEIRRIGFPWSPALVERSRRSTGATVAAARSALAHGLAANLAGGTHHAAADWGEGFCVFNDAVVAARVAQQENLVRRVLILDCDVHQGNGTASILRDDPTVYTFSIHGARNFPLRKQPSDLDIPLPDGTEDREYLSALTDGLLQALDTAGAELVIYLAGADPFESDRFGRFRMTKQGLRERDRLVLGECRDRGLPVAIAMSGGYAEAIDDIVDIHAATIEIAADFTRNRKEP